MEMKPWAYIRSKSFLWAYIRGSLSSEGILCLLDNLTYDTEGISLDQFLTYF